MKTLFSLVAGLAVVLAACGSTPSPREEAVGWPLSWSVDQPGHGASTLVNGLYLTDSATGLTADSDKVIAAVDPQTHRVAWSVKTFPGHVDPDRTSFTALGENIVALVVGSQQRDVAPDDQLLVINPAGTVLHTIRLPKPAGYASGDLGPYVVGDQLVVATSDTLYAYDAASLNTDRPVLRWSKNYADPTIGPIVIRSMLTDPAGNLYLGLFDNRVFSLTPAGQERWTLLTSIDRIPFHAPDVMAIDQGRLFVQAGAAGLQAYDLTTGKPVWNTFPSTDVCPDAHSTSALFMETGEGRLYLGLFGGDCVPAFNEADGSLAWTFTPANKVTFMNKPLFVRGVIYTMNGPSYALDAKTGTLLATGDENSPASALVTPGYDEATDHVLIWGSPKLYAYKAFR